jgi:hypothetical protein
MQLACNQMIVLFPSADQQRKDADLASFLDWKMALFASKWAFSVRF